MAGKVIGVGGVGADAGGHLAAGGGAADGGRRWSRT